MISRTLAAQEMEEGGMGDTLRAIVQRTMPNPKYARYHERHLQRFLSRLGADPPRCVIPAWSV